MNFNKHSNIEGKHAFLGGSRYHWIGYSEEKLMESFVNHLAAQRGTELHDFASRCIKLGQKLPKAKKTLNMFVNDAIEFKMESEQMLYFSENCFGTADAISFRNNKLRIHDYKSGVSPAHIEQLMVYAAIFCLEYDIFPDKIKIDLCIYQNNEVVYANPDPEEIRMIMDKIILFDSIITSMKIDLGV